MLPQIKAPEKPKTTVRQKFVKSIVSEYSSGSFRTLQFSKNGATPGTRTRSNIQKALTQEATKGLPQGQLAEYHSFVYIPSLGLAGVMSEVAEIFARKYLTVAANGKDDDESTFSKNCIYTGLFYYIQSKLFQGSDLVLSSRTPFNDDIALANTKVRVLPQLEDATRSEEAKAAANVALLALYDELTSELKRTVGTLVLQNFGNDPNFVNNYNSNGPYAEANKDFYSLIYNKFNPAVIDSIFMKYTRDVQLKGYLEVKEFLEKAAAPHYLTPDNILAIAMAGGMINDIGFTGIPKEAELCGTMPNDTRTRYRFVDTNNIPQMNFLSNFLSLKISGMSTTEDKTVKKTGSRKKVGGKLTEETFKKFLEYIKPPKGTKTTETNFALLSSGQKYVNVIDFDSTSHTGFTIASSKQHHKLYPGYNLYAHSQLFQNMINDPSLVTADNVAILVKCVLGVPKATIKDLPKKTELARVLNNFFAILYGNGDLGAAAANEANYVESTLGTGIGPVSTFSMHPRPIAGGAPHCV